MQIKSAEFIISAVDPAKCPEPDKPEFAFIGRSNVGKSSLINMITGHKGLAKISGSPGKTTTINHFLINNEWYLVDLPGYGFARRSKKEREKWRTMLSKYMKSRSNLLATFVLLDSRLPLQKSDQEFMHWMGMHQIPFIIVFTKADKLSKNQRIHNMEDIREALLNTWEILPQQISTSAKTKLGQEELLDYIEKTKGIFS